MMNERVLQVYNTRQRHLGNEIYLPQPHHRCLSTCCLHEVTGFDTPYFVCENTRTVHACGSRCNRRTEDGVCELTGFVVEKQLIVYNPVFSNVDPRTKIHDITCRLPTGRRSKRRTVVLSPNKRVSLIKECISKIMYGKERVACYKHELIRYERDLREKLRREHRPLLFPKAQVVAVSLYYKRGRMLYPPSLPIEETELTRIAKRLYAYNERLSLHNPELHILCQNIEIYTACMIYKLAVGSDYDGVTFIAPENPFINHVPHESQFGELGIPCNAMARMSRKIQEACLSSNQHVNLKMIFE